MVGAGILTGTRTTATHLIIGHIRAIIGDILGIILITHTIHITHTIRIILTTRIILVIQVVSTTAIMVQYTTKATA